MSETELAPANFIPLCVPAIQGNEWRYLQECLETGWVSSVGEFVTRFERALADHVGTRFAVATSSGTAALHVALLVAGIRPGDEVLVSDLTFIAPANAIRYVGAWPVFIGPDQFSWQLDPARLADFLRKECRARDGCLYNYTSGRPIRALLPVHILGHACDMDPIREIAQKYDLRLIEDASEALGTTYKGRPAGSLSEIACFSFNGNKIITSGGGGMIVTNNEAWAARAKYLTTQAKDDPVDFIHREVGFNYRLTNIQAALGLAQMDRLQVHVAAKRRIAQTYAAALADQRVQGISPMQNPPWCESTYWMYSVLVDEKSYGMDCCALLQEMAQRFIQARPIWQPMHQSQAHEGSQSFACEMSRWLRNRALSLPCSVGLQSEEQQRVLDALSSIRLGSTMRPQDF